MNTKVDVDFERSTTPEAIDAILAHEPGTLGTEAPRYQKTVNRHNLSIANLADKGDRSRFTLSAIHVTPEYTEVTDGHVLMRVANPDLTSDSFPVAPGLNAAEGNAILSRENALDLIKALPSKNRIPILATAALCSNGTVDADGKPTRYMVVTDLENVVKKAVETKGNFPDTDRVIPKVDSMEFAIGFDARLLGALCDQFIRMGNKKQIIPMQFHFQAPSEKKDYKGTVSGYHCQAALITGKTEEYQDVTAVIMPIKGDTETFWIDKRKRTPTKEQFADACRVIREYEAAQGRQVAVEVVDEN